MLPDNIAFKSFNKMWRTNSNEDLINSLETPPLALNGRGDDNNLKFSFQRNAQISSPFKLLKQKNFDNGSMPEQPKSLTLISPIKQSMSSNPSPIKHTLSPIRQTSISSASSPEPWRSYAQSTACAQTGPRSLTVFNELAIRTRVVA